ncbi:MAG TPA: tetratricopeptide repeat protein, partial [Phycisphaerae bacterium]|nr:tetratricopeptide repeat protein [Phycisphaerae bacterium]
VLVSSDDPHVLSWPWEALRDPDRDWLALHAHVERKLNQLADPLPLAEALPRDRVNVLLVTARPMKGDVEFRSISRPLVELIEEHRLPADVTLLRPPTFAALREHLHERPDHYHIVHFDGHGAYGVEVRPGDPNPHMLQAPRGHLIFETDDGEADAVPAERLGSLMREYRVPAVVLNACQSAMVDQRAEDAFASVAAALLKAGVRSVVAMAYSLYVSGAREFLPAFYRRLFECGNLAEPTRAGRLKMLEQPGRVCARGTFPLKDWLVPVVYQQQPMDFTFASAPAPAPGPGEEQARPGLPEEARDDKNPYGFVGRDGPILALERALRRPPAGVLIHGLGGIGKTTLARGFVRWLAQTGGLGAGCLWFTFNNIHNAEFVVNAIGSAVFGPSFIAAELDERIEKLAEKLNANRLTIVWDNFESASGIEAAGVNALLSAEDRAVLRRLLERLRGGQTKVLITSRGEEDWLGPANCRKLGISGLSGEERWEYCRTILRDLDLTIDRKDPDLSALMDALDGHPLMMRVFLPKLAEQSAASILDALRGNLAALGLAGDETGEKVLATLRFVEQTLPEDLRPLLVPLSLHERFADANFLERMAKQADPAVTRPQIDRFLSALAAAGLVRDLAAGQIFELHPALTGFLGSSHGSAPTLEAWTRAFVDVMGRLADALAPKQFHEQRVPFHIHGANFHRALAEAERLGMHEDFAALTQSLAAYAQNTRDLKGAEDLLRRLGEHHASLDQRDHEAAAYHELGVVAQERRNFRVAEDWYRKSLAIKARRGNEDGAASTYGQLGNLCLERRDFAAAEKWYLKGLAIFEKLGIEHGAATTYHQLGRIAEERRDFASAEQWYLKSLAIKEKQGNEHGAAGTYGQLGNLFLERRDLDEAEKWYLRSLAISEKQGDEHTNATTYHQLGRIAQERRDFAAAEQWYLKSLAIEEKQGNEHGAASTYHNLGAIAAERRDFPSAEQWYLKGLAIFEKLGIEHGAASTYHQLGKIAFGRGDLAEAEKWFLRSLAVREKQGNEHGAAITCSGLGVIARLRGELLESGHWLVRCVQTLLRCNDPHEAGTGARSFRRTYDQAGPHERAQLKAMWEEAGLGELPEAAK